MRNQQLWIGASLSAILILTVAFGAAAQTSRASLPVVIAAAVPLYPIGPHTVNIQGTVRVKVSTDGHHVTGVNIEDDGGHPALAKAAQENVQTWQFSIHEATTFTVTYRYILVDRLKDIKSNAPNSKVVLRFPTNVEVYARRWPGNRDLPAEVKPTAHSVKSKRIANLELQLLDVDSAQ